MKKFSCVIPVKGEEYLEENLPSWCQLNPDEIILCFDKPAPEHCVELIGTLAEKHETNLRILVVEKNREYKFHQAWVRRQGFLSAKHDKILTGDIDLQVFLPCLKAVEMVGKDDVGLVSLMKVRQPSGFQGKVRAFMDKHMKRVLYKFDEIVTLYYHKEPYERETSHFTGLYAMWRPYWLDSEDEGIKSLENPKNAPFIFGQWGGYCGEDTYLKNRMETKHKCVFLSDVGAKDFGVGLEETEHIQLKIGKYYFLKRDRPNYIVKGSIVHVRPKMLGSYIYHLAILYSGSFQAYVEAMKDIVYPWLYFWVRKLIRLFLGKEGTHETLVKYRFRDRLQNGVQFSLEEKLAKNEFA